MPRKKPKQEPPDKGYPSLIDWANGLTALKFSGMLKGRISHQGPGRCEGCGAKPRQLHIIPCLLEESPCGLHGTLWECSCEYHKED